MNLQVANVCPVIQLYVIHMYKNGTIFLFLSYKQHGIRNINLFNGKFKCTKQSSAVVNTEISLDLCANMPAYIYNSYPSSV